MEIKNFIQTDVRYFTGNILIIGSCLRDVRPDLISKLAKGMDGVYHVCLEEIHGNLYGFKLTTIMRLGALNTITLFTKDGSPHCLQLHLGGDEAADNVGFDKDKLINYVYDRKSEKLYKIDAKTVPYARKLNKIQSLLEQAKK
ncbi:MAG: hypothetical protein ABIH38_04775 [Patescibacteria group bacterium]